ncbi:MAG: AbrB family transcriptional regulator [Thermosynechococcaceae cyanobacterium MS004]|nr:AbrB family transcriptional regulator [Thermosynechococcaceae cyanobacterium MS004]MCG9890835.1 AbrB family transcriptional regulator [Thermosynechococcaceae cyanobacterium MS004]
MAPKTKKRKQTEITVLTGEELLSRVKELGSATKEEKAKACGYYTVAEDGSERIRVMKFLNALIDAEGIDLDSSVDSRDAESRGGRSASFRVSVQANGNILVGAAYTKRLELKPGDEFEISLGRRQIKLKQVSEKAELAEAV